MVFYLGSKIIMIAKASLETKAAVSCSLTAYTLGGVGLGFWLTGKLGSASVVHGVGAWRVHGVCMVVVVMLVMVWWGVGLTKRLISVLIIPSG